MASDKSNVWGHRALIDRLLVPRPLTHWLLLVAGGALAAVAWLGLPKGILTYASGILSSFCLLVAGAVWALRDRLDDALDGDHLTSDEFERRVTNALRERRRFMLRATRVALCALAAGSAAVSQQLTGDIWHWMVLIGGVAVGDTVYSYLLANSWDEQIRALRSRKVLEAKKKVEREELIARIGAPITPREDGQNESWSHSTEAWGNPHH